MNPTVARLVQTIVSSLAAHTTIHRCDIATTDKLWKFHDCFHVEPWPGCKREWLDVLADIEDAYGIRITDEFAWTIRLDRTSIHDFAQHIYNQYLAGQ